MNKILFSWIAFSHDFKEGKVDIEGPTGSFHEHYYQDYDIHYLLSSAKADDTKMNFLLNALRLKYPTHKVVPLYMAITDVINLPLIKSKIEPILLEHRHKEIDIFISPGTPAMQTAWILAHLTLGINTRLLQTRPKKFSTNKAIPELVILDIDKDTTTSSAIIRQSNTDNKKIPSESSVLKTQETQPIYNRAFKVAQAINTTVLILGETGTGKEHIAQYIHDQSPRKEAPFIPVNCSAMSDQLLESRLFGYKKGTFTGADKNTLGIIETAAGGTVFLDEIGDISPYMQQSMLRVLQEKEVTPIGGKPKKIDVRFLAATNKALHQRCEEGTFRWDLYYRLAVVDIELPSLQERGNAYKKQLVHFFLKEKKKLFNAPSLLKIPAEVLELIMAYTFPGNIRELENLIERLYVLSTDNLISMEDLPKRVRRAERKDSLLLKDLEKWHIEKVLKMNKGNKRKTARDIGVVINTLNKKIEDYGVEV